MMTAKPIPNSILSTTVDRNTMPRVAISVHARNLKSHTNSCSSIRFNAACVMMTQLGKYSNIAASVLKDRAFSRLLGTGASRPVPIASMALFGARDCITVAASFTLPPLVTPWFREQGVPAPNSAGPT